MRPGPAPRDALALRRRRQPPQCGGGRGLRDVPARSLRAREHRGRDRPGRLRFGYRGGAGTRASRRGRRGLPSGQPRLLGRGQRGSGPRVRAAPRPLERRRRLPARCADRAPGRNRGSEGRRRGAALLLGRRPNAAPAGRLRRRLLRRARRRPVRAVRPPHPRALGARRRRTAPDGRGARRAPRGLRARRPDGRALPLRVRGDRVGRPRAREGLSPAVRSAGASAASLCAQRRPQPRDRAAPRDLAPALPRAAIRSSRPGPARARRGPAAPRRRGEDPLRAARCGARRGVARGLDQSVADSVRRRASDGGLPVARGRPRVAQAGRRLPARLPRRRTAVPWRPSSGRRSELRDPPRDRRGRAGHPPALRAHLQDAS